MTPEELMKPRYKVIANFPNFGGSIGDILDATSENQVTFFNKYPHLFKKLQWWEERQIDKMPEYVKASINSSEVYKIKTWFKNKNGSWGMNMWQSGKEGKRWLKFDEIDFNKLFPATKEEYDNYNQQNNKS